MLTGLGIDEYLQRSDSAGARDYLTDILGSTLALTDSSGTQQTSYTYDPFGNSAATGQASANPYQFTGRENDGIGLDYYRARYYSPTLQRFTVQDPLDFYGGDWNLYAYVGNDAASETDPLGTITYSRGGRFRVCNKQESADCESTCKAEGKTVQSCVVRQIFRVSGGKGDDGGRFFPIRKWIDGPPSCSCNEPPTGEKCSVLGAAAVVTALGALSQLLQGPGEAPGLGGIPEPVLP
ncbi:RHS repeat-associated core domain-containing protein [Candidatus Binatus sp.]|uniref:RHS repeat-associated core domain-containing protein n=1 Tax=Candidatus Binatus sp. TaxID=2811406 RepID=UPI003C78230C